MRVEDHPTPVHLGLERRHRVLGEGAGVDLTAEVLQVCPAQQLRAPGQAGLCPHDVLGPAGSQLGAGILVADVAVQQARGLAGLADEGSDRADLRVVQVPGHPGDGVGAKDHVRIRDEHGLGPVVGEQHAETMVERVRLSLPALLPTQGHDPVRVSFLRRDQELWGAVGAGVVNHHQAQPI